MVRQLNKHSCSVTPCRSIKLCLGYAAAFGYGIQSNAGLGIKGYLAFLTIVQFISYLNLRQITRIILSCLNCHMKAHCFRNIHCGITYISIPSLVSIRPPFIIVGLLHVDGVLLHNGNLVKYQGFINAAAVNDDFRLVFVFTGKIYAPTYSGCSFKSLTCL